MIRARSPFQFSALECIEIDNRIDVTAANDQGATFTNGFENEFELIVARTKQGWYFAEKVPAESTVVGEKMNPAELNTKIRQLVNYMNVKTEPSAFGFGKEDYNYYYVGNAAIAQSEWGAFTDVISEINKGRADKLLPVNSYLAISSENKLVTNPQKQAIFEGNQLHVTIGKW